MSFLVRPLSRGLSGLHSPQERAAAKSPAALRAVSPRPHGSPESSSSPIMEKMHSGLGRLLSSSWQHDENSSSLEHMHCDEVAEMMGTGDLLLCRGTAERTLSLTERTRVPYQHVALVVLKPPVFLLDHYGIKKSRTASDVPYIFESVAKTHDGRHEGGVRLISLHDWLQQREEECTRTKQLFVVTWRRLGHPPDHLPRAVSEFPELMNSLMPRLKGLPFEKSASYVSHCLLHKPEDMTAVSSSELVIACYKAMGLLPEKENASTWAPHHFSQQKGDEINASLQGRAQLLEEVHISGAPSP